MEDQTFYPVPAPLPPPPAGRPGKGKALAVTALVLGIVALAMCWVPVLNVLFLFVGVAGVGFSIAALVVASMNSAPKGMSIAALVLSSLSIVGVFATQLIYIAMFNSIVGNLGEGPDSAGPSPHLVSVAAEHPRWDGLV